MKFKEFDKVKCINIDPLPGNEIAPPLTLGETYPINKIIQDSKGNNHLDIGLVSNYNWITSYETKERLPEGDKIHWCHPSRFEM